MKNEIFWVDKKQVESVISLLKAQLIRDNEKVVFKGFAHEIFMNALLDNIAIKTEHHKSEVFSLFIKSIQESYIKNDLKDHAFLLKCFLKNIKNDYKKKNEYYRVVAQMSLTNAFTNEFKRFTLIGFTVNIYKNLPAKLYKTRHVALIEDSREKDSGEIIYVIISGKANSQEDSMQKSLKIMNVIRALWRIRTKDELNILRMDDKYKNIAETKYYLAKYYTIHGKDGEVLENGLWHDEMHTNREPTLHQDIKLLQGIFNRDIRRLKKLPFINELLGYLDFYSRALDVIDEEERFIKLWQLTEIILDTDIGEDLITMLSFNFVDRPIEKVILKSLRNVRNRLVHGDYSPVNINISCYYLNRYIVNLFRFLLYNDLKLCDLEEVREILKTSTDSKIINEKLSDLAKEKNKLQKVLCYLTT